MSRRRRTAAWKVGGVLAVGMLWAASASAHEKMAILDVQLDDVGGAEGLATAVAVLVSPDGDHVYASSAGEGAVQVFRRQADGRLVPIQVVRDGENGVANMWGPFGFQISPDGKNLYVPTRSDNSLVALTRDPATGLLTYLESHLDGIGGVDALEDSMAVDVSPDGAHVYVAAGEDDAVAAFVRNPATGALTWVDSWRLGESSPNGPIQGTEFPEDVVVSPDGAHVYVVGSLSSAVATFARNASTGVLSYLGVTTMGVGLPIGGAISGDGQHFYLANSNGTLSVYARNAATGTLGFLEMEIDNQAGVDGLARCTAVAVSPSGKLVAAVGSDDDAVALFRRDPATGLLTFLEVRKNLVGGVAGLDFVQNVAFGPDDHDVYTVGWSEHALSTFTMVMFGDNFETGDTSVWFGAVGQQ